MNDVKTFTMPAVGGAALPVPQHETPTTIVDALKGTVATTVVTIKAAAAAGQNEAVLLAVREINAAAPTMVRTCPECGAGFTPGRSDQIYCTHRCSGRRRMRLLNQRRKDGS